MNEANAAEGVAGVTLAKALADQRRDYLDKALRSGIDEAEFPNSRSGAPERWRARAEGIDCAIALLAALSPTPEAAPDGLREALERWAITRKRVYVHWQGTYATANNADEKALRDFQEAERVLRVLVLGDDSGVERAATPAAAAPRSLDAAWAAELEQLRTAAETTSDWLALTQTIYHAVAQRFPNETRDTCDAGMCGDFRKHHDLLAAALLALTAKLREPRT